MQSRFALLFLIAPSLLAAKCRRNNHEEVVENPFDLNSPSEVNVQVVSMDPAWGAEGIPFKATLYGTGFENGARVRFGTPDTDAIEAAKVLFDDENRLTVTVPALDLGTWDVTVINPNGDEGVLRSGLAIRDADSLALASGEACKYATVYFEYDSNKLTPETMTTLDGLIPCLEGAPGALRLEGHTDERGTTEYNVALGSRRATTVRDYLVTRGVAPDRLETISYGEERPLVRSSDEESWSQNRRVQLLRR
jgi:peptidoglycan-associated lipoprotein